MNLLTTILYIDLIYVHIHLIIIQMAEFPVSPQSNSSNNLIKTFAPYVPPTKSYQPYIPSAVALISPPNLSKNDSKGEQSKSHKLNSPTNMYQTGNSNGFSSVISKAQNSSFKPIPSFLENRNIMKGSMITTELQIITKQIKLDGSQNQLNSSQGQGGQNLKKQRFGNDNELKFSSIELGLQNSKIPAFLQQKSKQKKVLFLGGSERLETTKELGVKSNQLTNSYGNLKKLRLEKDQKNTEGKEVLEWAKKSWNKKKQRVFTITDFEQIRELGSGKYGKVFLARDKKTNFVCALKILEKALIKQQEITEQIIRELKIQIFLNHSNLVKMYGFFDDNTNLYLIMEAATGGQLFKQLKKHQSMAEPKVASIMRQICQAVNELHSNRIIHRDIKPQNIVIHDNVIKLCDFGWSVYCDSNLRTTFCGTPLYVGPQILKGKQYDEKIDIWSLGVMMYEMLIGENPFKILKQQDLIKIIKDQIKIPSYVEISKQGREFLFSCLQKNPDKRLTIRELINHDFFKKYPDKNDKKLGI